MQKIIIASHNQGKIILFRKLFSELGCTLVVPKAHLEIKETGKTAEENAILKAAAYKSTYALPIFADDASIHFDALGGQPGLEVRRWMGRFPDTVADEVWLDFVIGELKKSKGAKTGKIQATWVLYTDTIHTKAIEIPFDVSLEPHRPYVPGFPLSAITMHPITKIPYSDNDIEQRCKDIRSDFRDFVRTVFKLSS